MAQAIKNGTVTSRQLVEMYIERIERLDGTINAVIDRKFSRARRAADHADEQVRLSRQTGETLGPFHGVPMTIKEGTMTRGFRMTGGDPKVFFLPKWISNENARRLIEDGGAVLMGKTNLPINQCDWECHNPIYGRTGNPYDPNRSPGGSSGGSAAALAAGFTPMELGSDIGGSIRIPAVMCGVVGHCPTRGVCPTWLDIHYGSRWWCWCCRPNGCFDRIVKKIGNPIVWLARIGPMARTVEDVTAMLTVLGGDVAKSLPRPRKDSSLRDYRIAVWRSHEICPPGREVNRAMDKAVTALIAAGVTVDDIELPMDPVETYKIYLRYLSRFMCMHTPWRQRRNARRKRARESFPSDIRSPFWEMDHAVVHGIPIGTREAYDEAVNIWDDFLKTQYDVILYPIFPCEAWPNASGPHDMLSDAKLLSRKLLVDNEERYYGDALFWSHLSVLLGLPTTAFPVGFTTTTDKSTKNVNLPVGLQVMGATGNDFIVLDVADKLMKALGNDKFQPPPSFDVVDA